MLELKNKNKTVFVGTKKEIDEFYQYIFSILWDLKNYGYNVKTSDCPTFKQIKSKEKKSWSYDAGIEDYAAIFINDYIFDTKCLFFNNLDYNLLNNKIIVIISQFVSYAVKDMIVRKDNNGNIIILDYHCGTISSSFLNLKIKEKIKEMRVLDIVNINPNQSIPKAHDNAVIKTFGFEYNEKPKFVIENNITNNVEIDMPNKLDIDIIRKNVFGQRI